MRLLFVALLSTASLGPIPVRGEVTLSSLVDGYCRVGECAPLQIAGCAADVLIEVDGALPVQFRGSTAPAVLPVLIVTQPRGTARIHSASATRVVAVPLRVLSENEKLVGLVGDASADDAGLLFPEKKIISIALDRSQPLPGTRSAWEVLDAILCDAGPTPWCDNAAIRALLGCGVVLAVRSTQPPDDVWPWLQRGDWWILQHDRVGPTTALSASAYAPVRNWPPGASGSPQVNLWWSQQSPEQHRAEGTVAFFDAGLLQHDFWEYRSPARSDGIVSCECFLDRKQPRERWARLATRPMLLAPEHAARCNLTLQVNAAGEPQRWTAHLRLGDKLAFVTRLVDPHPWKSQTRAETTTSSRPVNDRRTSSWFVPHSTAATSPLQSLVREAYTAPGVHVIGEGHPRTDTKDGFVEVFLRRDR